MTAPLVLALVIAAAAVASAVLEKRPGYGVYYGLGKLTGSRLDIGSANWATLTRHATPSDALVCPPAKCPDAKPDWAAEVYSLTPAELLARLKAIARADGNVRELPCEPDCERRARFIQYSRLMRFPDTIDIEVFEAGAGSTLAIYSRSLVGRKDFGVNRARVARWLAALGLSALGQKLPCR